MLKTFSWRSALVLLLAMALLLVFSPAVFAVKGGEAKGHCKENGQGHSFAPGQGHIKHHDCGGDDDPPPPPPL